MSKKKIYCGADDEAPDGSRFGTIKECADKGQIRRYGMTDLNNVVIPQNLADIYENYAKLDVAVKKYMKNIALIENIAASNKKLANEGFVVSFAKAQQQIKDMKDIAIYSSRIFYAEQEIFEATKQNKEIYDSIRKEFNDYNFSTKLNLIKFLKKAYKSGLYKLQDIVDVSVPNSLYDSSDKTLRTVFNRSGLKQMKAIFRKNATPSDDFINNKMFFPDYIELPLYQENTNLYNEARRWNKLRRFGEPIPFSDYANPSGPQLLQDKFNSYRKLLLSSKRFMED
jgi:hypothetical protein